MTLEEIEKTHTRFRKPYWNALAYLEVISPGSFWYNLYDPMSQLGNGWPCPQKISAFQASDGKADWEPYTGKPYEAVAK